MTFDAREISITGGEPVDIYEFRRGVDTWRFTSADAPIVFNDFTYSKVPIESGEVSESTELNKDGLEITVARDNPVAQLFLIQAPGAVVSVTVRRLHRNEPEAQVRFIGRVLNCEWFGIDATLHTESAATSKRRQGLRRKHGPGCPHVLYGLGCNVNQLAYKASGTVTAIADNTLTVGAASAQPDGYYDGGFVYWQTSLGVTDWRMIHSHAGTLLTLMFKIHGIEIGDPVDFYPGCKHILDDCINKFGGNQIDYGGWPYYPDLNPFSDAVF